MAEVPTRRIALLCLLLAALPGCGKKGPLYLPEATGEVVTRPAQTPPASESPASESPTSENKGAPNSPQTVDSQPSAPAPAPEVTAPEQTPKKDKNAVPPPRP